MFFAKELGYEVLSHAGIIGSLADFSILAGSFLDLFIGLWLIAGIRIKACYLTQLIVISIYTILLTMIEPSFWLHPFGPLTKNIPLLVFIYCLYGQERYKRNDATVKPA